MPLEALDACNSNGDGRHRPMPHPAVSCAAEPTLRQIAVSCAVARLPKADKALCAAVMQEPVDALVARGLGSRAGLYRRLRDLRLPLAAFGLQVA